MNDHEQEGERQLDSQDDERSSNETILMALDQISQTIDVMNSVVGRLRHFVEENAEAPVEHTAEKALDAELADEVDLGEAMGRDRILH